MNNVIKIRSSALIYDAAKSFALYVKGYTGFRSCTKCIIKEKYVNGRICFPHGTYPLRMNYLPLMPIRNFRLVILF